MTKSEAKHPQISTLKGSCKRRSDRSLSLWSVGRDLIIRALQHWQNIARSFEVSRWFKCLRPWSRRPE